MYAQDSTTNENAVSFSLMIMVTWTALQVTGLRRKKLGLLVFSMNGKTHFGSRKTLSPIPGPCDGLRAAAGPRVKAVAARVEDPRVAPGSNLAADVLTSRGMNPRKTSPSKVAEVKARGARAKAKAKAKAKVLKASLRGSPKAKARVNLLEKPMPQTSLLMPMPKQNLLLLPMPRRTRTGLKLTGGHISRVPILTLSGPLRRSGMSQSGRTATLGISNKKVLTRGVLAYCTPSTHKTSSVTKTHQPMPIVLTMASTLVYIQ